MSAIIIPGRPAPLGATPAENGTNFAVSSNGDEVRLCLFNGDGSESSVDALCILRFVAVLPTTKVCTV